MRNEFFNAALRGFTDAFRLVGFMFRSVLCTLESFTNHWRDSAHTAPRNNSVH